MCVSVCGQASKRESKTQSPKLMVTRENQRKTCLGFHFIVLLLNFIALPSMSMYMGACGVVWNIVASILFALHC